MSNLIARALLLVRDRRVVMPELFEPGHEVISGTIGMGKSFWVLYKIIKSFHYDRPCCYIDPKGDTYHNLLAYFSCSPQGRQLWELYRHRILFLNPLSGSDCILGFNAVEPMGEFLSSRPDRVALLADNLTSHIRRQSGFEINEAMRMQNILSAAIGLLVQGGHGRLTIAEMPYLFLPYYEVVKGKSVQKVYNPFVEELLPAVEHYGTYSFWKIQWPTMTANSRREWVQSSEGRIYPYIFDQRCLMTTCAVENGRLDFRRLVDEGYWLFVNIPYPLLSEPVSTLIGNLIITKIFYACMQRPPASRPYRLILDEARFFNTGPLDRILETSRAYSLWMTLVVQSLNQMCRSREGRMDYTLRDTALNNVRYWSSFHNTNEEDTETLARLMFRLTGQKVRSITVHGDYDYLPPQVEENIYMQRFKALKKRQVILYDKFGHFGPNVWKTPEVQIGDSAPARMDLFEAQHLQLTGRPASEIMREITGRKTRIEALFQRQATGRTLPPADFGGGE